MKRVAFILVALLALSFTYKNKKFKGPEGYVFIPSGSIEMKGKKYSCAAFWMSDHEVTNGEYKQFLDHLKSNGQNEDFQKALPDTSNWTEIGGYMITMRDHYFSHPAYADYPVVNVSKEGVDMYCKYLTEKYRAEYGNVIQDFRLPTRMEWMYAAANGKSNARYSWNGPYLTNENGDLQANYRQIGDHNITLTDNGPQVVADSLIFFEFAIDDAFITAPSTSYAPNEFGLYNMCGNVSEMVAKENLAVGGDWHCTGYDIRIESSKKYEGPSPFVGFRPVLTYISKEK